MHAFAHVHACNALSGTCALCVWCRSAVDFTYTYIYMHIHAYTCIVCVVQVDRGPHQLETVLVLLLAYLLTD